MTSRTVLSCAGCIQAFRGGDNDAARDCFTADVVWHLPGRSPLADDYVGFDQIFTEFFGRIRELTRGPSGSRCSRSFQALTE